MPTRLTATSLRLLDKSKDVARLHGTLRSLDFEIAETELNAQRFGRSTRSAVMAFQERHGLDPTGIADAPTLAAMRENTRPDTGDDLPEGFRFDRELPQLGGTARRLASGDSETAGVFRRRQVSALKQRVLETFDAPSENLEAAIQGLEIDLPEVESLSFSDLMFKRVLPELLNDETLERELMNLAEPGLDPGSETTAELLGLDRDVRESDELRGLVNRARNTALGDIVSLDDDAVDALADIDLSERGDPVSRLVEDGRLTETQRDELLAVADLARLTDDNFKAVRALRDGSLRDPRQLVDRDKPDWLRFIEDNEIEPPDGETADSYAAVLDAGVERAFPTAYAMTRYTAPAPEETLDRLSVLDRLPQSEEPVFVEGGVNERIDLSTIPEDEAEAARTDLAELASLSNRLAGLGIRDILNDRTLSTPERRRLVGRRQTALTRAWDARPDLDLTLANFAPIADPTAQAFTVELDDVDADDRPHVRRALMAVQRVYRLTDAFEEVDKLMSAGLDSANKIAAVDDVDDLAALTGLARPAALRVRARALETRVRMTHVVHGLEDTTSHAPFLPAILGEAGVGGPGTLVNVLKDLPGYEELFGPQNYCKCKHCQSIFSPAAYFVDLMRFIDRKISRKNFKNKGLTDHPLYLKNRRGDLWKVPLTCENTDNPVIYLTIVNEVLEAYLEQVAPLQGDVFEFLATEARSSFRQPFNLPHAEILLYLEHLGVAWSDISALFDPSRIAATHTILGISPQELATLITADPDAVRFRFAKPFTTDLAVHDTAVLTRKIGVDREMLDRLLAANYVIGNVQLETELTSPADDLTGFVEHIRIGVPENSDADAVLRAFLDRLHRFVRLRRALGWTPEEVQLAMDILNPDSTLPPDAAPEVFGAILDLNMLSGFADLKRVIDSLELSVSEAVALCHEIPDTPAGPGIASLRFQLFGTRDELTVRHPALGNTDDDAPDVSSDFGVLQGALRIAEPDLLELLRRELPEEVIASGALNAPHLDQLYRSARLARALGISQREFAGLTEIVPTLATANTVNARLSALTDIIHVTDQVEELSVELAVILKLLDPALEDATRILAQEALDDMHVGLREDDRLWLTPGDLVRIEGVSVEAASAIIAHLAGRDEPWVVRPDEAQERYLLTEPVAEEPDESVLLPALSAPGAPLAELGDDDHATEFLVEALRDELAQHHPARVLREAVADALSLSGDMLEALAPFLAHLQSLSESNLGLANWIQTDDAEPPATLLQHATELARLRGILIDGLGAKSDAAAFVAGHQDLFGIEPGDSWSWTTLRRVAILVDAYRKPEESMKALNAALAAWSDNGFADSAAVDLARYFDVTVNQTDSLLTALPEDTDAFDALQRLSDGVRLIQRTGLDPAALRTVTSETYAGLSAARDLVLGAMRTKHPVEETWRAIEEPFLEKSEGLKRDALVDRILSRPELRFENARDIYHFFLLDPEMDGCFRTSRVKNAITSCQLYVQRCLMGLEQSDGTETVQALRVEIKGGDKTREEWKWRKSYRVWEANRRVFLYPENYMLPDLRDDRSHIFKLAERDLLQGNLDQDAIEAVFKRYLSEFVQIGNLEIVHVLFERSDKDYLIFGRTRQEPFRYFMRRFNGKKQWEPWEPIDLDIGARTISAVRRRGKLYLFWTNVDLDADADRIREAQTEPGDVETDEDVEDQGRETMPVVISYSVRNEAGVWSSPQDILYYSLVLENRSIEKNALLPVSDRVYAEFPHPNSSVGGSESGIENQLRLIHPVFEVGPWQLRQVLAFLRESDNKTIKRNGAQTPVTGHTGEFGNQHKMFRLPGLRIVDSRYVAIGDDYKMASTAEVDYEINDAYGTPSEDPSVDPSSGTGGGSTPLLEFSGVDLQRVRLQAVQRKTTEAVLHVEDLHYLIKRTGKAGSDIKHPADIWEAAAALLNAKRKLVRLNGSKPADLSETLYAKGIDALLDPSEQFKPEPFTTEQGIVYEWLGQIKGPDEDLFTASDDRAIAQFDGPLGCYLWEVFFHLPFLTAHTLNSIGKFEEADRWYRYIFDPTASGDYPDAHWRFVVFRTLQLPKLREILTQKAAINAYKRDPFNPFAIARLRPSAFQKTIVMRYIDNLLDQGDDLFRRDTRESINEALLLYVMAADLLGERPVETGECEAVDNMTYEDIVQRNTGGEFLVELENVVYFVVNLDGIIPVSPTNPDLEFVRFTLPGAAPDEEPPGPLQPGDGFTATANVSSHFESFATVRTNRMAALTAEGNPPTATAPGDIDIAFQPDGPPDPDPPPEPGVFSFDSNAGDDPDPDGPALDARTLGFCVPPNEILLGYWDRVEDRLFKLRHCMNIEGVERQLPLWQPPINPMLLVRARAAGLDLDGVLAMMNEQPPHHRFEVLLDRARRFTSTAQQLGSQLLSALERKDENELVLLRSVHEDTILNLSRRQKEDALSEAKEARLRLDSTEETIRTRLDHYSGLIGSNKSSNAGGPFESGMNKGEKTALDESGAAKDRQTSAGEAESKAQRYREIGPQWTAGGSLSVGYHGKVVRVGADGQFSWGSVNIEGRFQRRAFRHRDASSRHSASAGMAAMRAGHERRLAEWELQRDIANKELAALEAQKAVADIRIDLAEKDLETHDAQIKNSREIYEFAKERFTGLGLYTYLTTSLSRLYREAYDMAFKMAHTAERAYRFEVGEDSFFLKQDNWNASRAGLLAGERLLLQLQAMEAGYVERDRRRQEVTLPCSLSRIDPDALVRLRQEGRAEFTLPEWWFDLFYPGQYRRMLQAVRLTIPCVTGPYSNVGAKLTLIDSAIRTSASPDGDALVGVQVGRNTSISTSSANSDPGVFELRFDGPRNPPFKGAGAVSSWVLELPAANRAFDYTSISDVIVELSYSAEDDGVLQDVVQGLTEAPGSLDAQLQDRLVRIISLRHEFPTEFHNLMRPDATEPVELGLKRTHLFPHWVGHRSLQLTGLDVALEPKPDQDLSVSDLQNNATIELNGDSLSDWVEHPGLGSIPVTSSPNVPELEDPLIASIAANLPEDIQLYDLLIRLTFKSVA